MPNPKLATFSDAFTGTSINLTQWNRVTGTTTLDQANDLVTLAVPTASGGTNVFGNNGPYDCTGSYVYAQVTVAANGGGNVSTRMRIRYDSNNAATLRLEQGVFKMTMQIGGTLTNYVLPVTYDPNAHRWWRLRESGGSIYADTSPDGLNWTNQQSAAYGAPWDPTNINFQFEAAALATEVAGNVATFSHVNTMLGGAANINWPLLEEAWGPNWGATGGDTPLDRYVDITSRTRQQSTVSRGKQYELDQILAGEAALELLNTDGALDPMNTSGPWYGAIRPYQPYRKRAQWPPTRNLLTQVIATGGDLGGYSPGTIPNGSSGIDVFSNTDSSGGSIVATTSAWQGGSVFQFNVPSATASATRICWTSQAAAEPGSTYTCSMWVRDITASTTLQVQPAIGVYTIGSSTPSSFIYGSTVTLTGSTTAAWTQVTVTATVPAGAVGIACGLSTAATAAATCNIQADGWQYEKAGAASTWCCPGTWYPWFGGYMERWPSSWNMGGTYGTVQPTAVDAAALLSQVTLLDPLTAYINSHSPTYLYTLGDPQSASGASDATGNFPQAPLGVSKYGAGSLTFGNQIASTSASGAYIGSTATVAYVNNPSPGQNLIPNGATFISLSSAGIKGPANPQVWVRMIAFRYTGPTPTASAYLWSAMDKQRANNGPSGSHAHLYVDNTGRPVFWLQGPTGVGATYYPGGVANVVDGNWHLLIFGYNQSTQQVLFSQDGSSSAFIGSVPTTYTPTGIVSDTVGAFVDYTDGNGTDYNFQGNISFAAEFSDFTSFAGTAITDLYNAWKSAFTGDSSNARYQRILGLAGYTGLTSIQTGVTTSMGPADWGGQDALSALQAVVDTENGQHFVDRSGTMTFQARSARYNSLTPVYVFGENTASGEWPYEDCQLDYDPTHLGNVIQVTQASTNQVFTAQDATSQSQYFPRTLTRTINASSSYECQDASNYLLSRYKQPATRISTLVLHPSANPQMWPVCLSLEVGMRIRVNRRPPAASAITVDCFVENIQWSNDDGGEAFLTLQCSPVDLTPYGLFASFHTTLHTTIASGVSSITINAGADSTNPAATQIAAGQQLVLGQNTANQETVTVKSVATTTSGWTTCVITLTANTTKSHTSGDTVCEPLPAGTTDPTTWDSSALFDSVAFAY